MSTDLIQRLRFLASGQDDVHSKAIDEAADALERMGRSLALVQQHHATAWNRGHEAGMRANRDIAKQATDAVKRDAWGNSQLTEALLAAEAERDQLRAEVEALRGLKPEIPQRPPHHNDASYQHPALPRYGLRWNGPGQPVSVPMADGYWTPFHLALEALEG